MKMRNIIPALVLTLCLGLMGCDFGEVEQGRCVAYDANSKTVTIVMDMAHDPNYKDKDVAKTSKVPVYAKDSKIIQFVLPADPKECGPEPVAGGRVMFDLEKGIVLLYDAEAKAIEEVQVEFLSKEKMKPSDPRLKGKKFPEINKTEKTVQEYSKRLETLVTFKIPDDKDRPDEVWTRGDEVRLYYKENAKHQALRFMNISKTNIYKR